MKVPVLSSLILLLGLSSHLPAIERPKALDENDANERPAQRAVPVEEPEAIPQVNQGAYLGVLSESADETLGIHLGFEKGVVLQYVAKDSPAAKAGLEKHDVVTAVDGRGVANQDELRNEILKHQIGDEVNLEVVSKGQKAERKVLLGARPADLPRVPQAPRLDGQLPDFAERFPDLEDRVKDLQDLLPNGGAGGDLQKRLQAQMQQLEKSLKDIEKGGGLRMPLDLQQMLEDMPKPGKGLSFKHSSSFKFLDDKGSVEMKMKDGGKEATVRDKEGNLLYEGPWDTPQDKAAAPPDIRDRIDKINDGNSFHFHLENMPKPRMELPKAEDEELE